MIAVLAVALAPATMLDVARGVGLAAATHLVVSEVVTGGAIASDELIELHNPTTSALPLEGLEVIYVTSSGATISRRAAWEVGAPSVPAGGHVLVANASGIYAPIADATYAVGMAATGGSVAIRILGASTAVDAVGWGTTTSTWREGSPAAAPAAGASIERLPGGALGSGQRHGRQRRGLRRAPRPRTAESRLAADAGPGGHARCRPRPLTPPSATPDADGHADARRRSPPLGDPDRRRLARRRTGRP